MLEAKYHPNNINGDEAKYRLIKEAYDYLYDHMELLNEAIHNKLTPWAETHTHSYSWSYEEEERKKEEARLKAMAEARRMESEVVGDTSHVSRYPEVKIKDRPTLAAALFSFVCPIMGFSFFFMTRRITPKSAWLYLILAVLGAVGAYLLLYFML